ncbi:S53 family peptidase [Caldivirga maquilingensis]|uniref:Protease-like protein n=1 Tax=Caldivirga maquilingensis (strain ATCC 700844 / DSM 13496 / JCM 10307 / IC-167) TaxID=397948 RepID=A8M9H5_CALMQ|nr:S53 family peptidase [Caldivirga maquilingensis]ABW00856.1 protease-like protein [Caldivirga maquilingensis IC-167]
MDYRFSKGGKIAAILVAVTVAIVISLYVVNAQSPDQPNPYYLGSEVFCIEYGIIAPNGTFIPLPYPTSLITFLYLNNATGLGNVLYSEYYNPSSPLYHRFISAAEFDEWYSAPASVYGNLTAIYSYYNLTTEVKSAPMYAALGVQSNAYNACISIINATIEYFIYNNASFSWVSWVLVTETNPQGFFLEITPGEFQQLLKTVESINNNTGVIQLPVTYKGQPVLMKYAVYVRGSHGYSVGHALALYLAREFQVQPSYSMIKPSGVVSKSPLVINGKPVAVQLEAQSALANSALNKPSEFILQFPIEVYLPQGIELLYNATPLYPLWFIGDYNGYNGSSVTVGIVDAFGDAESHLVNGFCGYALSPYNDIIVSDVNAFSSLFDLPPASITVIYPAGEPFITPFNSVDACGWSFESVLDNEWVHAIAPGARIVFGVSPDAGDDLYVTIEYMVNESLVNFISLSWGLSEDYLDPYYALAYDQIFMQAAAQGIGVFASSGDSGAYEFYPFVSAFHPSIDPWVTGVGGTTSYLFPGGSRFITAWSFYSFGLPPWDLIYWGSGGGYSIFFDMPLYQYQYIFNLIGEGNFYEQTQFQPLIWGLLLGQFFVNEPYVPTLNINPYTPLYRTFEWMLYPSLYVPIGAKGYPIVSADANPYTGVLIVIDGELNPFIWGGTSLASPLTMGMVALWQDYLNKAGIPYQVGLAAVPLSQIWATEAGSSFCNAYYPTSVYGTNTHGVFYPSIYGQNGATAVNGWVIKNPCIWNPVNGFGSLDVGNLVYYGTQLLDK